MPVCRIMAVSRPTNRAGARAAMIPETMAALLYVPATIQALAEPSEMRETAAQPSSDRARRAGLLLSPRLPASQKHGAKVIWLPVWLVLLRRFSVHPCRC